MKEIGYDPGWEETADGDVIVPAGVVHIPPQQQYAAHVDLSLEHPGIVKRPERVDGHLPGPAQAWEALDVAKTNVAERKQAAEQAHIQEILDKGQLLAKGMIDHPFKDKEK